MGCPENGGVTHLGGVWMKDWTCHSVPRSGWHGGALSQTGLNLWGLFQPHWFCEKSTDSSTAYTSEYILTVLLYMKYISKASHRKPLCSSLLVREHQANKSEAASRCVFTCKETVSVHATQKKTWRKNYLFSSCLIRVWITFHLPLEHLFHCPSLLSADDK